MPNQLSTSKRRITLAEQNAVLAALNEIADLDQTTASDLLRFAVRKLIAERATDSVTAAKLQRSVLVHAPSMPTHFRTPAQVARFKRQQREFDQLLQEMNLAQPEEIQARNSVVRSPARPIMANSPQFKFKLQR